MVYYSYVDSSVRCLRRDHRSLHGDVDWKKMTFGESLGYLLRKPQTLKNRLLEPLGYGHIMVYMALSEIRKHFSGQIQLERALRLAGQKAAANLAMAGRDTHVT